MKDSFIISCRNVYWENSQGHPFDISFNINPNYRKLVSYAKQYSLGDFLGYFLESQYYINLWTTIILLNEFDPKPEDILIGLNDQISIIDECIDTLVRYKSSIKTEAQLVNYNKWKEMIIKKYNLSEAIL